MGMLKNEEQPVEEQKNGDQPVDQQMAPAEQPAPTDQQMPPGEQQPADTPEDLQGRFNKYKEEAVYHLYGDRYADVVNMFRESGAEGFPNAVATAVNDTLTVLKKKHFDIDHNMAAVIGMDLWMSLIKNMAIGELDGQKLIDGLEVRHLRDSLTKTISMYAKMNPDITDEQMQDLYQGIQQEQQKRGMAPTQQQPQPQPQQPVGGVPNGSA